MVRFHGITQTDEKLKCRVRKTGQATREAHTTTPSTPMESRTSAAPTPMEAQTSAPPTPMEAHTLAQPKEKEAASSPSAVINSSRRRKTSQDATLPHDTEASAPQHPTTPGTDELTLPDKKPAAKKRSHMRKAGAIDVPLKKSKQQRATTFEDKTNF